MFLVDSYMVMDDSSYFCWILEESDDSNSRFLCQLIPLAAVLYITPVLLFQNTNRAAGRTFKKAWRGFVRDLGRFFKQF